MMMTLEDIRHYLEIKIRMNKDIVLSLKLPSEDRVIAQIRADAFEEILKEIDSI